MDSESGIAVKQCTREWRCRTAMLLAVVFPLALSLLLSWYGLRQRPEPFSPVLLQPVVVTSSHQLEALFSHYDYFWPPRAVPPLAVKYLPPDLGGLQVKRRKSLFFRTLLPLVVAENIRLRRERAWLLQQKHNDDLPERVLELAREFRVNTDQSDEKIIAELMRRVDEVPAGLVLAQAANESGWGTSRFALEVNNLFGQWTWDESIGVVPNARADDASHFVRRFDSLRQSVRAYLNNINSGHAYHDLRLLRAKMRAEDKALSPLVLAQGLERYSSRGAAYVEEIRAMIRHNNLNKLGQPDLLR